MTVSYTPTFHHTDWVDNVDRVQAGGPNGFNTRFETIESDLHGVSSVVGQIDAALTALGTHPAPTPKLLTFVPTLSAVKPTPGWDLDPNGIAVRPQGPASTAGMMSLALPDGVTLTTLRALGQNTSTAAVVRVSLLRAQLLGIGVPPDRLARVPGDADPFDHSIAVAPALATVDVSAHRYFILATVDNAAAGDIVTITAIQLGYLAG